MPLSAKNMIAYAPINPIEMLNSLLPPDDCFQHASRTERVQIVEHQGVPLGTCTYTWTYMVTPNLARWINEGGCPVGSGGCRRPLHFYPYTFFPDYDVDLETLGEEKVYDVIKSNYLNTSLLRSSGAIFLTWIVRYCPVDIHLKILIGLLMLKNSTIIGERWKSLNRPSPNLSLICECPG